MKRHKKIAGVADVRIFRFDSPLMFINAELFHRRVYAECSGSFFLFFLNNLKPQVASVWRRLESG
jgi:hypothetical protein